MDIAITIVLIVVVVYLLMRFTGKKKDKQAQVNPGAKRRSSYGKWIGGGLGWAFGGPIGAILGFAFGSMYDGMQSGDRQYSGTRAPDFSASLLVLAAAVMKADGKVLKSELNYVKLFFERQFGTATANEQILLLRDILQQDIPVTDVCLQIKQYMDYSSRLQLLHFLFGVSSSDGNFHPKEVEMIEQIARDLGVTLNDMASIKAMFIKDTGSAYKILEISANATDEEVKKAYHKMAIKYHPDKVAHLGPEIQKSAKEKFQKLTSAYDDIKQQRGIK